MEQVKTEKAEKAQNRLDRELDTTVETRVEMQRPTSWQAPETLPSPFPRPKVFHTAG
jgi:hypothetical protein